GPELRAAFLDVGTRDVKFQRADAAEGIESPRHFGVFLNRGAPDVDDGRHFQVLEERPVCFYETVHARSLQTDSVDEAAGDLNSPRRRVAANRFKLDAFHHHGAELVQVEELCI